MTMPTWRECDGCRIKMPSYMPRRRVGDQMLCDTCAKPKTASADHDVLYHITDKHRFSLDPDFAPHDNTFSISPRDGRKGIYLTDDPDRWRANGYHRPYVAEVHVPKGLAQDDRWHGEKFLPAEHYDKAKVHRVMPFDEHQRERWGGKGTIEEGLGSPASTPPGKDVRDFTPEEHTEHLKRFRDYAHDVQRWGWNEFNDQHEHVGTDETDDQGMDIRRDREGNVMTGGRYAKKSKGLPKTQKCKYCDDQATKRLLWAEGMGYIPVCDAHEGDGRHQIEVTNKDEVVGVKPIEGTPKAAMLTKEGHDSGDGMTIFHCPFCGSGQVIARSDRTIECSFCHIAFTVQVQPVFAQFPQTIDGQPVQVPGMPGQIGGDPMMGADPNAPMDPSQIGPDGEPLDPSLDPQEDADGIPGGPESAGDDEEDEGPESPDGPPWAKKSYRTAAGHELSPDEYARHIAIKFAEDPREAARAVRESR